MAKSTHAVERTSPKGQPFVGTCIKCGKTGLGLSGATQECENVAGMSSDEALIRSIDGPAVQPEEGRRP